MRIRGLGRLKLEFARIKGQLMPGPMVILYHRVAHLQQDPHLLAVAPKHFEEQLIVLQKYYHVVPLSELTKVLSCGSRPGHVIALTFDDGYADNFEIAYPILKKHNMPATFYLSSGFIGSAKEFLHDDLERLFLASSYYPEKVDITISGKSYVWDLHSENSGNTNKDMKETWTIESKFDPTPFHHMHRVINNIIRCIPPGEREKVSRQLHFQFHCPEEGRLTHRAMTWDQARAMATCELIELGAHTVNHPYLSSLSFEEQRIEIQISKQMIEEQIGRPVTSFAYPFGTRESYNGRTIQIVKELGFKNACSNFRSRIGHQTDLFQIPRFVVRDWDGAEFQRHIHKGRL